MSMLPAGSKIAKPGRGLRCVFLSMRQVIKSPDMLEKFRDIVGVLGELKRQDARTVGFDFGAFKGIVINKK